MKILCFADFHLGWQTYSRINPQTGLHFRVEHALKVLDDMINYAIKKNIKVIVAAGDMYKNVLVSDTIQYEFNSRITNAANKGITILLQDGNHDVSTMESQKSPLAQFDAMKVPNIIHTRFHKEYIYEENGEKIKFVFIPTYHTQTDVKEIVDKTTYDGFPIVYIMHGSIRGALLNDWLIEENEKYVEADVFDKEGVAAVVLGHLHKHQLCYNKPLVFYTSSTNRIDFSEEHQEKGFVVLEVEPDGSTTYDFVEVDSIRFLTIKDDLRDKLNPTDHVISLLDKESKKMKDAIVRIKIDVDKSTSLNEKRIYEHAYELGASFVLNLQKKFETERSTRVAGINESITEEKALELFFRDRNDKDRDYIINLGKELISNARAEGKI